MADKVGYETVIRVVKGEDTALVRTSNRKLKNKLHGYDLDPDDEAGGTETFEEVPVAWLRIQRPRQFTEEELEATRERLSKALGRSKKGKAKAKPKAKAKAAVIEEDEEDELASRKKAKAKAPAAKAKGKKAAAVVDDDEIDDDPDMPVDEDEDEDEPIEIVKRKAKK